MDIQAYRKHINDNFKTITAKDVHDMLQKMRENNVRDAHFFNQLFALIAMKKGKSIESEYFVEYEQEIIASLDNHSLAWANIVIKDLMKLFPKSSKVSKYLAMSLEAGEYYQEAEKTLDSVIENDETNSSLRKRKIALLKAQGMIPEAIKELVEYLKKFMSDVEAWQELCDLYLQMQDYQKAVFCAEEALLHQPHHNLLHQKVADIRYTMGGVENMELAKSYYCHAIKLNSGNMRALFGLMLTANYLQAQYKSNGNASKRKDVWHLYQWVNSQIAAKQEDSSCHLQNFMMLNINE